MIRRPPRSTQSRSSAASDVYKRQSASGAAARTPYPLMSGMAKENSEEVRDEAAPPADLTSEVEAPVAAPEAEASEEAPAAPEAEPADADEKILSARPE